MKGSPGSWSQWWLELVHTASLVLDHCEAATRGSSPLKVWFRTRRRYFFGVITSWSWRLMVLVHTASFPRLGPVQVDRRIWMPILVLQTYLLQGLPWSDLWCRQSARTWRTRSSCTEVASCRPSPARQGTLDPRHSGCSLWKPAESGICKK